MSRLFIYGAGEHGRVVADAMKAADEHTLVGYVDAGRKVGDTFCGYPVLANCHTDSSLSELCDGYVIALGDNAARQQVAEILGENLPTLHATTVIHPAAIIGSDVIIGDGSVILAGAIVNPNAKIGQHCIINTKASVDHDSTLGHYASLAPGVTLGGKVSIGEGSFVGLGANVIHGITIGDHSVVGAGSLVRTSMPDNAVAYGTPAQIKRTRASDEPYL